MSCPTWNQIEYEDRIYEALSYLRAAESALPENQISAELIRGAIAVLEDV